MVVALTTVHTPTEQEVQVTQCFSLLLLGLFLSALATLNFSLSFLIGLLSAPLCFVRTKLHLAIRVLLATLLILLSPVSIIAISSALLEVAVHGSVTVNGWCAALTMVLGEASDGWHVQGVWTPLVIWCVWWPASLVGLVVLGVKSR